MSDNYNNEHIPQRPVKKQRKKAKEEPLLFIIRILLQRLPQAADLSANPNRHGQKK